MKRLGNRLVKRRPGATSNRAVTLPSQRFAFLALPFLAALAACSAGAPARAVRPALLTANSGMSEERCSSMPLVVDLPSSDRGAVEAALERGRTLLARQECTPTSNKLTLLTRCELFDGYEYAALSRREEVVRMTDADAVRAKLPLAGEGFALNLSGELSRGRTLDLALVNIGRYVSRAKVTHADEVPKDCAAANRTVMVVSTGAFAMSVGSRAQVRAVAEIFSAGTSGESESNLVRASRDGELGACVGTDRVAPAQCRAPLRIELRPIDPRSKARASCEDSDSDNESCGHWLRRSLAEDDKAEARAAGSLLLTRCRRGALAACVHARLYVNQMRDSSVAPAEIDKLACEGGGHGACTSHGQNLMVSGKVDDAIELLRSTCFYRDEPDACGLLGRYIAEDNVGPKRGPERDKLLANLQARGCQTNSMDCERYAAFVKRGIRAEGDFPRMKQIVALCDAKQFGCSLAAAAHALGLGVPRDLARAQRAYAVHCEENKRYYIAEQRKCEMPKVYGP